MKSNERFDRSQPPAVQAGPVEIRGHTLLCLQGFRGEGYSPDFIDNMAAVLERLQAAPGTRVRVTVSPDQFCAHCPNLNRLSPSPSIALGGQGDDGGCALRGPGFEREVAAQDRSVLDLLGLRAGEEVTWEEVLFRIGSRLRGDQLPDLCGDCQWLPLGTCREGIDRLNHI